MDRFTQIGQFHCRDGLAKERGMKTWSKKALCFTSTDKDFLVELLYNISQSNDCYNVKLAVDSKQGVYCAHCHFTNELSVGDIWAKYDSHPKVWVVIQDEEFYAPYKSQIRTY